MKAGGKRGLKKPGWPDKSEELALRWLKKRRKSSPRLIVGQAKDDVARSQNWRSRGNRISGSLPAMMAELIDPIEMPESQSGSQPASDSAW